MTKFLFQWPVRVYYEDTDCGGVVYHTSYLRFMERARAEWLRLRGFEQDVLAVRHGVIFAVHSLQVEYLYPARFNELLQVSVRLLRCGAASLNFEQQVLSDPPAGEVGGSLLCSARVRIACLDSTVMRPCRIPTDLITEIGGGN